MSCAERSCVALFFGSLPSVICTILSCHDTDILEPSDRTERLFRGSKVPCHVRRYVLLTRYRLFSSQTAYDFELRKNAFIACSKLGFPDDALVEGNYVWVAGPSYETTAECKFLRAAGADVVGMS